MPSKGHDPRSTADINEAIIRESITYANADPRMLPPRMGQYHEAKAGKHPVKMVALQAAIKAQFDAFLDAGKVVVRLAPDTFRDSIMVLRFARKEGGGAELASIEGTRSTVAAYSFLLGFALLSDAGRRLRRCADAKCPRYFLRSSRMKYCSRRCARRVYMRDKRQRERRELEELRALRRRKRGKP